MQKSRAGMTLEFGLFEENKRLECSEGWQWGEWEMRLEIWAGKQNKEG